MDIDAKRLAAHQLSILQVREALNRQNAEVPGGRVDEGTRERALRTLGRVSQSSEFKDLVITNIDGHPIRLSDLGTVQDTTKEVRTLARMNGQPAVVMQIQRQSGENTVAVIEAIKERLPRCSELLPDDVEVTVIQDQSRYILEALHGNPKAPHFRKPLGVPHRSALYEVMAVNTRGIGGDPRFDHRDVCLHEMV